MYVCLYIYIHICVSVCECESVTMCACACQRQTLLVSKCYVLFSLLFNFVVFSAAIAFSLAVFFVSAVDFSVISKAIFPPPVTFCVCVWVYLFMFQLKRVKVCSNTEL